VLTRQGWLVLAGGLVLLVVARLLGISELYVFGACALGLVAFSTLYVAARRLELEVDRTVHPARVHAGRVSRVDVRVRNLRATDTPVLRLHEPVTGTPGAELLVPPLSRRAAAVASYRLPTDRRGLLTVGPLDVVVGDPFGLAKTTVRASEPVDVTVYPKVEEVRAVPFTAAHDPLAGARQPHALGRTGEDFYALRPYVVGDDLRRIHWPSTARHDEMLVRQQEQPWQGRTTILVDTRRATHDDATFEAVVSAAASIAVANGVRRDVIRLMTTDGTDSGFGVGQAHLQAMLEHLAMVQSSGQASLRRSVEVLGRTGGGALVVLIGQVTGDEMGELGRLKGRFGAVTVVQADRRGGAARGDARPPFAAANGNGHGAHGGHAGGNGNGAAGNGHGAGGPGGPGGHAGDPAAGNGSALGPRAGAGAPRPGVPFVTLVPGRPFAPAWDPVIGRQSGAGGRPSGAGTPGAAKGTR
jgi:uncharacterized protein (DUF58 family)